MCSSILWRDSEAVQKAADSLKLTADECLKLKVINEIIPEEVWEERIDIKMNNIQIVKKQYILEKIIEFKNISYEDLIKVNQK